ncbi:MAG: TlpA family protein disulfide reductase [Streptosporangiales bacterium]|nr:TlpA family protein disulfide reductase [Streptosporangiales bacterium]
MFGIATLLAGVLAAGAACAPPNGAEQGGGPGNQRYISGTGKVDTVPLSDRRAAPVLSGTSLTGTRVSTSAYRGKVVVVNFWASWCAPCRSEAPYLQAVQTKTKTEGVQFVGVNFKDNKSNAQVFAQEFHVDYPSIYDEPGETALAFRGDLPPQAVPSTIVVDRQGRVAARIIGEATYTRLLGVVRQVAGG